MQSAQYSAPWSVGGGPPRRRPLLLLARAHNTAHAHTSPHTQSSHARARRAGPDPDEDGPGTGAGQYPGEKVVTFPPFTCLETDGEPRVERSAQGEVVIFPLKVCAPTRRTAPAQGDEPRPGLSSAAAGAAHRHFPPTGGASTGPCHPWWRQGQGGGDTAVVPRVAASVLIAGVGGRRA